MATLAAPGRSTTVVASTKPPPTGAGDAWTQSRQNAGKSFLRSATNAEPPDATVVPVAASKTSSESPPDNTTQSSRPE